MEHFRKDEKQSLKRSEFNLFDDTKYFRFLIVVICRAIRRQSLSEIGFGRLDTYTKLDKLGEVRMVGN